VLDFKYWILLIQPNILSYARRIKLTGLGVSSRDLNVIFSLINLSQQLKVHIRSSFTFSPSHWLPGFFPWGKLTGAWFWPFTCSAEVRRCGGVRLLVLFTLMAWTDRTWHFCVLHSVCISIHPLIDLFIWRHTHTHARTHARAHTHTRARAQARTHTHTPVCTYLCFLSFLFSSFLLFFLVLTLTLRLLMSYIYGAPILDVSRSHTTTQHSR